jgi:hypothetical protein
MADFRQCNRDNRVASKHPVAGKGHCVRYAAREIQDRGDVRATSAPLHFFAPGT